jgi:hypothetical protein
MLYTMHVMYIMSTTHMYIMYKYVSTCVSYITCCVHLCILQIHTYIYTYIHIMFIACIFIMHIGFIFILYTLHVMDIMQIMHIMYIVYINDTYQNI